MQRKAMTNVSAPIDSVGIRTANRRDLPALISLINKAFAIETFLEGTRTDEEGPSATMRDGDLLMAERDGLAVACVYVECSTWSCEANGHILECLPSMLRNKARGWKTHDDGS
jgi:N-acetylglutamate synthase-like GNAT family acetyltransferase